MKILLAMDGSEPSETAVRTIAARPWPAHSTVRVLSVAQPIYPSGEMLVATAAYEQMTKQLVDEAKKVNANAAETLRNSGLALETTVREGDPRTEIVDEAKDWSADLVVVGSHGRTGIKRWLLGSVAEYVVRYAPCSVEVAKNPIGPPGKSAGEHR
jgi:nucleotide-binding universal stress UspA family protein